MLTHSPPPRVRVGGNAGLCLFLYIFISIFFSLYLFSSFSFLAIEQISYFTMGTRFHIPHTESDFTEIGRIPVTRTTLDNAEGHDEKNSTYQG